MVEEHVVVAVEEVVDSTGSPGTLMLLLMRTGTLEAATDALKEEMLGGVVDTVDAVVATEILVTWSARVGTLSVTVEQLTGKEASSLFMTVKVRSYWFYNCKTYCLSRHELKRDGAGRGNWGTIADDIPP